MTNKTEVADHSRTILFWQIEEGLARVLNLGGYERGKLRARIRAMQKIGLGPKGKLGVTTIYSERQAFEVFLGTWLNVGGMPPEYALFLLNRRWPSIHKTAEAGKMYIFHPEGALHNLQSEPVRKNMRLTEIWPVGSLRAAMLEVAG